MAGAEYDFLTTQRTGCVPYFKYRILNSLRDELGLTQTFGKFTFCHFLYLALPAAGLCAGAAAGRKSGGSLAEYCCACAGLAAGALMAWLFPVLLWNMLRLFLRKRWFLRTDSPKMELTITIQEFALRSLALRRDERRYLMIFGISVAAASFAFNRLIYCLDHSKPSFWSPALKCASIMLYIGFWMTAISSLRRSLFRKHRLQCAACGELITNAAGLVCAPHRGICRHCGAKVIET